MYILMYTLRWCVKRDFLESWIKEIILMAKAMKNRFSNVGDNNMLENVSTYQFSNKDNYRNVIFKTPSRYPM